jgi:hypothetical protein
MSRSLTDLFRWAIRLRERSGMRDFSPRVATATR